MWTKNIYIFKLVEYVPSSTTVGLYSKIMFSFVKNCQAVFHSGVPLCILISNEWEFLLLHFFVPIDMLEFILTYIVVVCFVLIFIPWMTYDVAHIFVFLFAICIFFGEVAVQVFWSFFNWVIFFRFNNSYPILDKNLSDTCLANIFSQSVLVFLFS